MESNEFFTKFIIPPATPTKPIHTAHHTKPTIPRDLPRTTFSIPENRPTARVRHK